MLPTTAGLHVVHFSDVKEAVEVESGRFEFLTLDASIIDPRPPMQWHGLCYRPVLQYEAENTGQKRTTLSGDPG